MGPAVAFDIATVATIGPAVAFGLATVTTIGSVVNFDLATVTTAWSFSKDGLDGFGLTHFLKGKGAERETDTYKKNKELNPVKDLCETLLIGLSSKILTRHIKMFPVLETFLN